MSRTIIHVLMVSSALFCCRAAVAKEPIQYDQFIDEYPRFAQLREKLALGGDAAFYTLHLHHAKEPDLGPVGRQGGEAYRLILIDSGKTSSDILRVQPSAQGAVLVFKKFNALNIYQRKPGELTESSTPLTADQWNAFKTLISKADFWKLPTEEKVVGLDGVFYLIEGVAAGQHHIVARYGDLSKRFRAPFKYLQDIQAAAEANPPDAPPAN